MAQENREVVSPVNPNVGTKATKITNLTRINPLEFHGFKVYEDRQEFIDEIYNMVDIMRVSLVEKVK